MADEQEGASMFAIIDVTTGEAVNENGDPGSMHDEPMLFDTEQAAQDWAVERFGEDGVRELRVDRV